MSCAPRLCCDHGDGAVVVSWSHVVTHGSTNFSPPYAAMPFLLVAVMYPACLRTGRWLSCFGKRAKSREAQILERMKVLDDIVSDAGVGGNFEVVHCSCNLVSSICMCDPQTVTAAMQCWQE